ncbi:MAG TPA: hypothetical protein VI322_04870 [Candidatus Saccharimonadia bacterium]
MDAPMPPSSQPNPNVAPSAPQPEQFNQPALEQTPAAPVASEAVPATPEAAPVVGASPAPASPAPAAGQQPVVDPMALAMAQPMPASATQAPQPQAAPLPNLAADVDVIEPEWVDKAEEVVRQHVGDPYGEEEAVEALQEDYLQKRYGLTVHEPDEDTTKTDSV